MFTRRIWLSPSSAAGGFLNITSAGISENWICQVRSHSV
jgi:hypothetical protein